MRELVNQIGTIGQDNLIAKLSPAAECFGVTLTGTAGATVKRGTVLGRNASNGKYAAVAAAESNPAAILADDVTFETGETEKTAVAYRTGNFNRSALITGNSYALTAADEDALRKYQIILTDPM